jgi:hypothetical protein
MKNISVNDFKVSSKIVLKERSSTFNLEAEEDVILLEK